MNRRFRLLLVAAACLVGSFWFSSAHMRSTFASSAAFAGSDPVNHKCPVMGGDVNKDSPSVTFHGHDIGFCCAGCEPKWNAKPEAEKMAFLAKYVTITERGNEVARSSDSQTEAAIARTDNPSVKVARAYLAACEKIEVDALNALFLDGGRATVLENASNEGTWETYRDHHLVPEMKEMSGFKMVVEQEDVQTHGSTSIVRHVGYFMVTDPNHKELQRKILSAVTYVVVDDAGSPKIAHLHWSSRAAKTTPPVTDSPKPADHPHGSGNDHK